MSISKSVFLVLLFTFGGWFTFVAAGIAIAGVGAGLYENSQSTKAMKSVKSDTYNPYGEVNTPAKGAIASRDAIFGSLGAAQPGLTTATGNAASALTAGANNPAFGQIGNYGAGVLRGDYLNSPLVNSYATQAGNRIMASGADTRARTGASLARAGQGFSTGDVQALQTGDTTAATNAAQTEAGIKLQNYQAERTNQQNAPGIMEGAISQPISYATQAPGAMLAPLQTQANITQTLLGNQQVQAPTLVQQPTTASGIAGGISQASSLYNLYQGLNQPKVGNGLNGGTGGVDTFGNPVTYAPGYGT